MSVSSVRRMVNGETLPRVENIYGLARLLNVSAELLLDTGGYLRGVPTPERSPHPLLSTDQPPTPEAIADALGITHPFVRRMLTTGIREAVRIQREADQIEDDGEAGGTAAAR